MIILWGTIDYLTIFWCNIGYFYFEEKIIAKEVGQLNIELGEVHYIGPITAILENFSEGQKVHDFGLVPKDDYEAWHKHPAFMEEKFDSEVGKHKFYRMCFKEDGHEWSVLFTQCEHPNPRLGNEFAFIVSVVKDGNEISHSKMSIEEYDNMIFDLREAE